MFNWKIFGHLNSNYPQCPQSIYEKIYQELHIFVDRNYGESWTEKITDWMYNCQIYIKHMIDWQMFLFLVLTLTVIISIYIITVEYFKVLRPISRISMSREMSLSDTEDDQMSLIYHEFVRKSPEISEILKSSAIFHFNPENYNQFYVVSLGMDGNENSSLQINEIFDDPNYDEIMEFKTIVDDIIDRVEFQLENCQKITPQSHSLNLESRPGKTGSRIPLLRSRQR